MFGGLIVLNQRRSRDGGEPGPEQNFTRSLCEGAPKHCSHLTEKIIAIK